jgi:UDPglucose 6-dehydrogenase
MDINRDRRQWVVDRLHDRVGILQGRRIALLGLAFKANTDDVREAPALDLIRLLQAEGAEIRAYDPVAMETAAAVVQGVEFSPDAYTAVEGAEAAVIVTEWNEFKSLDLERLKELMARPILVDGRNLYEPEVLRSLGFEYIGVSRRPAPEMSIVAEQQVLLRD